MTIIQFTEKYNNELKNYFEKVFKENGREFAPHDKDSDILNITDNYMLNGNFWCLIDSRNNICGTIALRKLKDCYEIRRFFVLRKYQGYGYGSNLLNIAINYAIDSRFLLIKAATLNNCYISQHLFNKIGFTRTERYNNSSADIFFQFELTRENIYNYHLNYLKHKFESSLILNPTENVPFYFSSSKTDFFTGLYVSECFKDVNDKVIFAGRNDYIKFFNYIKKEWKKDVRDVNQH